MNTKLFSLLGLAATASLVACVEPQPRPDSSAPVARKDTPTTTQNTPPTAQPTQAAPTAQPTQAAPTAQPTAAAQPTEAVREKVMTLLGGIEHIPTKEEFARAGSDDQVFAVLDAIAHDKAAKLRFRSGAASAIGLYPRPEARKSLESLINEADLDEVIRRPSIKAYASAFGAASVPVVAKMLEHKDRNTREAALRSLAEVGSPDAKQAIEARSKVETDDALKKLAQETLARWKK